MKKFIAGFLIVSSCVLATPTFAKTTPVPPVWKATTPDGYAPLSWVSARGVSSFMKAPTGNGYTDYLTVLYLPYLQVKLVASSTQRVSWGDGKEPFDASSTEDWAFAREAAEATKQSHPDMKFMWNAPFFNEALAITDLSLALKSEDEVGEYLTSGSRPDADVAHNRKMLIVDNNAGTATIADFDPVTFAASGDQAVEGFAASETYKGTDVHVERLFIGVKPGGKELVIYCSKGGSPQEAGDALVAAGVPIENQLQADGGTSATCAYNLPGQYFVEPGRTLPHLMGAFPILYRAASTIEGLNVRQSPSTKSSVVRTLKKSEAFIVYEEKTGWVRIGTGQWVSASLVKKI